jgi:hypothetical protein
MSDPRISAWTDEHGSCRQDNLKHRCMKLTTFRPIQASLGCSLQELQQRLRIFGGTTALQDDGSVVLPADAHGRISFKSSTRRTRPSPSRVVPA